MESPLRSNVTDVALVFEGGGMRGSYTSAVAVELLNAGIYIDYVAGISAGSSNTGNYLARDARRTRASFVEFAADPNLGNLRTFMRGQGLFNSQYIYLETGRPGQALPYDFETYSANPATMRIGAFRCDTGEPVYWGKEDAATLDDLMVRVRASSSMPFLMPPVTIGDGVYLDGAIGPSGGIPLDAAKADGYTKFLIVLTRQREYVKPPFRFSRGARRLFKQFPAVADALLARPLNYNRTREEVFDLEASGDAMVFVPETMPVSNGERNVARLRAAHELGLAQTRRALPRWKEWMGLD